MSKSKDRIWKKCMYSLMDRGYKIVSSHDYLIYLFNAEQEIQICIDRMNLTIRKIDIYGFSINDAEPIVYGNKE